MTRLLQLSDPHFGTERPEVVEALAAFVHRRAPDLLVLSGDITQRARRAQFAAARAFCDRLGIGTWLAIPGNHDIPLYDVFTRAFAPYRGFRRAFGDELAPVRETADLLAIGVLTTRRYRHKHGEVSPAQVEAVAAALRAAPPEKLRVVVTHQPVDLPPDRDQNNLLRGREAAVRAWVDAGVDLILGGHIHLPFFRLLSHTFPDLPRRAWAAQAGTAVSHRIREEANNSVNVVEYRAGAGEAIVERWDYGGPAAGFVAIERHAVVVDRAGTRKQELETRN
jgi:3',5'-cyclic AMP phosphodiesterase CpdA